MNLAESEEMSREQENVKEDKKKKQRAGKKGRFSLFVVPGCMSQRQSRKRAVAAAVHRQTTRVTDLTDLCANKQPNGDGLL